MKIKYLKNLSFFFSILFLFLLTILFILTLIISYKPIKLNFTDYFDRESKTFKRIDIKEIGDIYISFNKSSKNFELLIEDLLIDETYLPSTLISLDFTFSENIFQTSIKIFDAEITLRDKSNFENVRADEKNLVDLISEKITFIQIFNVIEIINSKILIFADDNVSQKYSVDLNFKNNSAFILLSELFSKNNFVTMNLDFSDNFFLNFKSNNFNIDILSFLYPKRLVAFDDLRISGESNLEINRNSKIESFEFDLFLTGSMSYETNSKEKLLNFDNNKFFGIFNDNELSVSFNFYDIQSNYEVGIKNIIKKTNPSFFLKIDKIYVKNLLKIWPKNLMNSTFAWMKENSTGTLNDVNLEVDFNIQDRKIQIVDVFGTFEFKNININYMEGMPEIIDINGTANIENTKATFDIKSGNSNDLNIISGNVDLYDLDTDFEKAKIDLYIQSENSYLVDYLKLTEIEQDNYNKLQDIEGDVNLNLKLDFPLLVDLKAEEINYLADADIINGYYKLLDDQYGLDSFEIKINVMPDIVNFTGSGNVSGANVNFEGKQILEGVQIVDEIEGKINIESSALVNFLPQEYFENSSGSLPIRFSFIKKKNDFRFEGVGETDQFNIESKLLGKNANFSDGKLRFIVSPYGEKISGFLDVKTKNIDIEVNTISSDLEIKNIEILKFKTPNQDFSLTMKQQDFTEINIQGNTMTMPTIKLDEKSPFDDLDKIKFNLSLSEIIIGVNKFNNPIIDFKKDENEFSNLNVRLDGEKDYHKIIIEDVGDKKKFFLETNFAPGLFNIF